MTECGGDPAAVPAGASAGHRPRAAGHRPGDHLPGAVAVWLPGPRTPASRLGPLTRPPGSGTGILWAWRIHWTASMSNGRPWPVRCPAALSRVTSSSLLVAGPSRLTSSMAAGGVRLAVPEWAGLSMVSSSVAPVCQRIPIRALLRSGSGSTVTSAIRVRSRRLRSLALVVGAFHRAGGWLAAGGHLAPQSAVQVEVIAFGLSCGAIADVGVQRMPFVGGLDRPIRARLLRAASGDLPS